MAEDDIATERADLLEEYKLLIPQIVHWDTHFWNKSKFFLTFESASLAGTLIALREVLSPDKGMSGDLFLTFMGIVTFNLYLSYAWFRTNRRNREFFDLRCQRARDIEAELAGPMKTFSNDALRLPRKHSSVRWEVHLPTGFALAWGVMVFGLVIARGG